MKRKNLSGIFSTVFVAAIVLTLASCSQDDEFYEDGLFTRADEMMTRSGENSQGGEPQLVTYEYPTINEIKSSQVVISKAQTAWNMMLSSVTDSSRVEYGFYIYYNHSTRQFYCGEIRAGATVYGCQGTAASLDLGRAENNRDVCAFYHCHTTLNKCPENCQRATGPSSEDVSFATSQGLPGLVEDYAVATLKGQMSAGLPHVIIPFGPTQRPDQEFPPISL